MEPDRAVIQEARLTSIVKGNFKRPKNRKRPVCSRVSALAHLSGGSLKFRRKKVPFAHAHLPKM